MEITEIPVHSDKEENINASADENLEIKTEMEVDTNDQESDIVENTAEEVVDAQAMTDAIYSAHETLNDAVLSAVQVVESSSDVATVSPDNNTPTSTFPAITSTDTNISPQLLKEQLKYCQRIIKGLKRHRDATPFLAPVDPVALGIPDYYNVIKHPMDLGTISKRMDLNQYNGAEAFMSDVRLVLNNCFTYNAPDSQVSKMGRNLEKYFNTSMAKLPTDLNSVGASSNDDLTDSRPKRDAITARPASNVGAVSQMHGGVPRRPSSGGSLSFCSSVLRELMKKTNAHLNWPFMIPVDPIALGLHDYFDIIKHPMDLSTIRKKLDTGLYGKPDNFEADVRLMFSNCYTYNPPESDVHKMGRELEAIFDQKMAQKPVAASSVAAKAATAASAISSASSSSASLSHSQPPAHSHAHPVRHPMSSSSPFASQMIPGFDSLDDDSEKILAINQQIQILQGELNDLLLKRKPGSTSTAASMSTSSVARAPRPKKKASPAMGTAASASTISADLMNTAMTFDEKRKLSEDVGILESDHLVRVLEIIQECMPNLNSNGESDVIELDIEALDVRTLRTLQAYIFECIHGGKKRKGGNSKAVTNGSSATNAANAKKPKSDEPHSSLQSQQQQPQQQQQQSQPQGTSSDDSSSEDDD